MSTKTHQDQSFQITGPRMWLVIYGFPAFGSPSFFPVQKTCIAGCRCPAHECPRPPIVADPGLFHPQSVASRGISHQSRSADLGWQISAPEFADDKNEARIDKIAVQHTKHLQECGWQKLDWTDGVTLVASPSLSGKLTLQPS